MTAPRCLYRPGQPMPRPAGAGFVPKGQSKEAVTARNVIGEFLDARLARPVSFTGAQLAERVNEAMDTMTIAERVLVEIEMAQTARAMHSYDYEAL